MIRQFKATFFNMTPNDCLLIRGANMFNKDFEEIENTVFTR